jgi:hypothetical protein
MIEKRAGEHTFRVVRCDRRVRGIRPGDPVVLVPLAEWQTFSDPADRCASIADAR